VVLVTPYAGVVTKWLVAQAGGLGSLMLQFVLTAIAAAAFYAHGELAANWALRFGARLAGDQGEHVIRLSGQAIRGVALGVVVTAIAQTLVGAIGLFIAGVPFAAVLTLIMFLLAVAQVGAALVMAIPVFWLYWTDSPGMGTFLLVVTLVVATMDNVLRPILIKKGADLPLVLIFVGVIGGLVSFGLIGIFIGPVVLAVTHTLLNAWMDQQRVATPAPEGPFQRANSRSGLKPVTSEQATSTSATPGTMPAVTGSPRNSAPQVTPNMGIMKADEVAALAGISRISRMLIQYMKPEVIVPRTASAITASGRSCTAGAVAAAGSSSISAPATCTAAEAGSGSWVRVARFIRIAPKP